MPHQGAEQLLGADGQPFIYPAPVILRNTFVDVQTGRPLSLEGFFQERQAHSCPTSLVSEPGSYIPGVQLMKSAALDLPREDATSECSTADTAEEVAKIFPTEMAHIATDAAGPRLTERLEAVLQGPALGSPELPSVGSAGHARRDCKPCAFVATKGCAIGVQCHFCHLCEPGEKKRRQKGKRQFFGAMKRLQQFTGEIARPA